MLRRGLRFTWLLTGAAGAASVTGIVLSCLPDLAAPQSPTGDGGEDSQCGDGIIQANEQCDPGIIDGSVPGCSRTCKIECDAGELSSYLDPSSNHCYFLLSEEAGPYRAGACAQQQAHIVTLGSAEEEGTVANPANLELRNETQVWLGVHADSADAAPDGAAPDGAAPGGAYRAVVDEPGFNSTERECPGCFLVGPFRSPTSDAGCVTWSPNHPLVPWRASDCNTGFATLCEREPAGSRATTCDNLLCFNILLEARQGTHKTYVWTPGHPMMSADAAASYCGALGGDAGTATLVIFESAEEREQIFYELMHINGGPPADFWIGLTYGRRGGVLSWNWDDMRGHGHLEWADGEPKSMAIGVRAYASQSSKSYDTPAASYDTQLWHAASPDAGTEVHGVLCQILQ